MRLLHLAPLCGVLVAAVACGSSSSDSGVNEKCVQACDAIQDACGSAEADCGDDCASDLDACPAEMDAVLDCVLANQSQLQCDADEDQGLAEAPCETEHAAVHAAPCKSDPF